MHTQAFDPSLPSSWSEDDDRDEPFLEVEGIEGSALRATNAGLTVCPGGRASAARDDRRWSYDQLREVRLDAYGPVGVIRATVSSTGAVLPLLLLEPVQIAPARRSLEIIWNLMGYDADRRSNA
jgi:hypothetical protein